MPRVPRTARPRPAVGPGAPASGLEPVETFVEAVPTPLVVVDRALVVLSTNRAFREELGRDLDVTAGQSFFDSTAWQSAEPCSVLAAAIGDGHSPGPLLLHHDSSRGRRILRAVASPVPGDVRRRFLVALTDVTAEDELERLRTSERLQRDAFLGAVSHELRTPLAAITLWTEALRDLPPEAPLRTHAIQTILESAAAEAELVEDLIELAMSRDSRLTVQPEDMDLASAIDKAVVRARATLVSREISLEVASEPGLRVLADPRRVRQVVSALISNAVKFTPERGVIRITTAHHGGSVSIRIADSGPGIPPEIRSRIFDPLWQADLSATRARGGLGIGLALVKHLVQQQGGMVELEPMNGAGAAFVVHLPVTRA